MAHPHDVRPPAGPRIVKFVRALYRLHRDSRVNLLIKLLIPLAVIYAIFPFDLVRDRIPYGLGRYDDIIILALAVWLFWNLCPRAVVREHMGEPPPPRPEDDDPDSVVDGQARPADNADDQRSC
ncbi:hypothetical protein GBAR_LOCUS4417 [Geodia barretti]|uniref:DUF1232 domain-containing protein n=1 Tax=Geodia barretti TaxID=519541 RepID=A0AA35R6M8_GEOBA|nr:hypothetical protein GBAR_LOCUS4417 [Geodia barretti]